MSQPLPPLARPLAKLARTAGVLLAGGRSSRFGTEKAVAQFRSRPLMETVMAAFARLPRIAVSAKPLSGAARQAYDRGIAVLADDASLPSGPLAGVAAGLEWAQREGFDFIVTAPCDAPLLPRDFVSRLAAEIGAAPAAYAITALGEHPLCALWRVELREQLMSRLAAGEHPSVRGFLKQIGATPVRFEDASAFANANTAAALAALELHA